MTIEEFLEDLAKDHSRLQAYQKNKSQFAEDCVTEIFNCLRVHKAYTTDYDVYTLNLLICEFKKTSTNLFVTLGRFMEHYKKTDVFSYQIIPEENWNKEIELEGIAANFKAFCSCFASQSLSFEDDVTKFREMRNQTKTAFLACHKMLKKKTFEYFPAIIDLPSLGLRELDFLLFQETKKLMHTFIQATGF